MNQILTSVVCPACREAIPVNVRDSARVVSRKRSEHLQGDCPGVSE